jgi:hypothetical protein
MRFTRLEEKRKLLDFKSMRTKYAYIRILIYLKRKRRRLHTCFRQLFLPISKMMSEMNNKKKFIHKEDT